MVLLVKQLTEKVAIVTGAGQGVGRGIANALAEAGANIAVVGRTLEKCERTSDEIRTIGGQALAIACDVGKPDQVEGAVQDVLAKFGRIDILVNNAQAARPMVSVTQTTEKDLAVAMKGMKGTMFFMQSCHPHLVANKGRVINLGSVSGIRGDAGFAAYAMAKEAIRALSRVAAREWGESGVTVNVVCPFSDSPGTDYMKEHNPGFIDALERQAALGRLGRSKDDVGRAVVFLASEEGGFITGQTINIDGGMWIAP